MVGVGVHANVAGLVAAKCYPLHSILVGKYSHYLVTGVFAQPMSLLVVATHVMMGSGTRSEVRLSISTPQCAKMWQTQFFYFRGGPWQVSDKSWVPGFDVGVSADPNENFSEYGCRRHTPGLHSAGQEGGFCCAVHSSGP